MKTSFPAFALLGGLALAAGMSVHGAGIGSGAAGAVSGAINSPGATVTPPPINRPEVPHTPAPTPKVSGGAAVVGADAATKTKVGSQGEVRGLSATGSSQASAASSADAASTLNAVDTLHAINGQDIETRGQLFTILDARIAASTNAMEALRQSSRQLDAESRAQFEAADKDVKAKEQVLQTSLKAAHASSADTWNRSRDSLANDYKAYATAVASAQTAASVGAKKNP